MFSKASFGTSAGRGPPSASTGSSRDGIGARRSRFALEPPGGHHGGHGPGEVGGISALRLGADRPFRDCLAVAGLAMLDESHVDLGLRVAPGLHGFAVNRIEPRQVGGEHFGRALGRAGDPFPAGLLQPVIDGPFGHAELIGDGLAGVALQGQLRDLGEQGLFPPPRRASRGTLSRPGRIAVEDRRRAVFQRRNTWLGLLGLGGVSRAGVPPLGGISRLKPELQQGRKESHYQTVIIHNCGWLSSGGKRNFCRGPLMSPRPLGEG